MLYDLLPLSDERRVTLCGSNVYPIPEYHPDRVMEEHDLLYIHEGEWNIAQDDEVYHLRSGDLIFLRAGGHHYSPTPCSVNARTMFIHCTRLSADRGRVELPVPAAARFATGREICLPTVLHCAEDSAVPDTFREIINVFWSRRDDRQRKLTLLLNLLLSELSYQSRRTPPPHSQITDNWLIALLQALHTDTARFYTLEEAAELTHMQVRTLSARFRKLMGKSVHQYQLDLKLDMAYNALTTGQYSVKQVADSYGFCDPYYFSRVFKKRYGIAPSEIKRGNPAVNVHRPWIN